jgi:hypothetical protein
MDNESSTGSCVIEIGDDEGRFFLMYKEEPQASEIMIVDMLLDHFGRRQVTTFQLKCIHENMDSLPRIFSPGALQRFLERTTMLKNLKLKKLRIHRDTCAFIGHLPRNLDSLKISGCNLLDAQQLFNGIGANLYGPKKLVFKDCEVKSEVDFASFIVPLLNKRNIQALKATETFTSYGNLQTIKEALQRNIGWKN